jgi:hypothetical protein
MSSKMTTLREVMVVRGMTQKRENVMVERG